MKNSAKKKNRSNNESISNRLFIDLRHVAGTVSVEDLEKTYVEHLYVLGFVDDRRTWLPSLKHRKGYRVQFQ